MKIVMLHGYGANSEDLRGLENFLRTNPNDEFIFPNGILSIEGMPSMCRAWFEITQNRLFALSQGKLKLSDIHEESISDVMEKIDDQIGASEGEDIVVGGFSQGAMCAAHFYAYFKNKYNFKGLVTLSGHLLDKKTLDSNFGDELESSFQSHGLLDQVLGIGGGLALKDYLLSKNPNHKFIEFSGGHEIPLQVLQSLKEYLKNLNRA